MKRRFFSAVCAMILLLSLAVSASAAQIDKHIKGSISVTQAYKGKPVAGGSMSLYYVADLEEANGCLSFAYTDAFKGCTADLSGDLTSAAVAREISIYAAAHDETIVALHKQNFEDGKVWFYNLPVGLYLLVQHDAAPGYSSLNPFLVSVPKMDNGVYDYDVNATPKMGEVVPEETTKPTTPPAKPSKPSGNLPQTGQLNWPVPVLAVGGLILFLLGWYLVRSGKRREYEI